MALADGGDSDVIGECPGDAPRSGDSAGLGAEEEGNESHAKWSSLGDATKMPVCLPEAPSNSVAIVQLEMELFIRSTEPRREASSGKKIEQQDLQNF